MVVFSAADVAEPNGDTDHLQILCDWLNLIGLHANGAPVLLVGTHKDQLTAEQLAQVHDHVRGRVSTMQIVREARIRIQKPGAGACASTGQHCFFAVDNTVRVATAQE